MIGIRKVGIGVGRGGSRSWNPQNLVTEHIARVEADGGVVESEAVLLQTMNALRDIYKIKSDADFKAKLPVTIDPAVFGYKVGAGALSTLEWAAAKLYSINSAADVVQATAGSQPALLTHNDIDGNYLYAARKLNPNIRTNNNPGIAFTPATDTLIVTAKILVANQTATSYDAIVGGVGASFLQIKNRGANLLFRWAASTSSGDSTEYTPPATVPHWIRVTATPSDVKYEWSANGLAWTELNAGRTPPTYGANGPIAIAQTFSRVQNAMKIYYVKVENTTIDKEVICDFNDWIDDIYINGTDWKFISSDDDSTQWNIQYVTTDGLLKNIIVDRSLIEGDGLAMKLSAAAFSINQPYTIYSLMRRQGAGSLIGLAAASGLSNDATNMILNNGTALNIANSSVLEQLVTASANGANSKIRINAGADTSGDAGENDGTYLDVLGNGAEFGNHAMMMLLISAQDDSDAIKTAMNTYFNG